MQLSLVRTSASLTSRRPAVNFATPRVGLPQARPITFPVVQSRAGEVSNADDEAPVTKEQLCEWLMNDVFRYDL